MNDLQPTTHNTPCALDSPSARRPVITNPAGSALGEDRWAPAPTDWGSPRFEPRPAQAPVAEGYAPPSVGEQESSLRFVPRGAEPQRPGFAPPTAGPSATDPIPAAREVLASAAAELSPSASPDPSVRVLVSVGLVAAGAAFGHAWGVASIVVCALIFVATLVVAEHEKSAKLATPAGFARLRRPTQHAQRCPLCRDDLSARDHALACPGCATAYHLDCLHEIGGCTVVGCAGEAGSLKPGSPHAGPVPSLERLSNGARWRTG